MTAAEAPAAASTSGPRPNPFALPSGTTLRFLLLLLAILLATIRFGPEWGTLMLGQGLGPDLTVSDACLGTLDRDVWPSPWVRLDDEVAAMQACSNATSGPVSLVKLAYWLGALPVLVLTLVGYWLAPAWRVRRRGLVEFPGDRLPEVASELDLLARQAGVRVRFLLDPLDPRVSGLAFGRVGRRYVVLSRGLLRLVEGDREAFRAVVLHELAHVRNRDLDVTQLTVGLWWTFLALTVPLVVWAQLRHVLNPPIDVAYEFAWLTAFVLLVRNAVLRSRELHADARGATWSDARAGLERLLAAGGPNRIRWPLRRHPPPAARLAVVHGTVSLLSDGFWVGCALGLALSMQVLTGTLSTLESFYLPPGLLTSPYLMAPVVVPVAGGLVLSAWRAAVASFVQGKRPGVGLLGLGLAAGLAGGTLSGTQVLHPRVLPNAMEVFTMVAWAGIVTLGSWAFVSWLAAGARAWLGASPTRRSTIVALVVAWVLATPALLVLLWALQSGPQTMYIAQRYLLPWAPLPLAMLVQVALGFAILQPAAIPVGLTILLAAYPLLAGVRARAGAGQPAPSWLALDPIPASWRPPEPLRPRPGRALAWGAATGVALLAVVLILDVLLAARNRGAPVPALLRELESALIPGLAAAVTATRTRDLRVVSALLVSIVAGLIAAPGVELASAAAHCVAGAAIECGPGLVRSLSFGGLPFAMAGMPLAIVAAAAAAWLQDTYEARSTKGARKRAVT